MIVRYRIAGRPLRIHFADRDVCDAFAPALAHLEDETAEDGGLDLHVVVDGLKAGATRDTTRPRLFFEQGAKRGVAYPAAGVSAVLEAEEATCWIPPLDELPAAERSGPFRTVLQWWLSRDGVQIVHAGAVGTERGAALLVGRGGSGKSVTSVACALAGMQFLGDDSVACSASEVHSLYATATVHAADLARFAPPPPVLHRAEKAVLDLRAHAARSLPLAAILVPRVTTQRETTFAPLCGPDAVKALAPSSLFNLPGSDGRDLSRIVAIVRAVPAYALHLGSDAERIPDVVRELIG